MMTPMTNKERKEERQKQSAFLTTVALCVHSFVEGVAMGSSLYCKLAMSSFLTISIYI